MLYEIHMIKNYPPTNLNRDDTGSPKTCYFGGSQRGRISSQCLKRTWRTSGLYDKLLGSKGIRTRTLPALLERELAERGCEAGFIKEAAKRASGIANKDGTENDKGITTQIIIYAPQDIAAVADKMMELYAQAGSLEQFRALKAKEIAIAFSDVAVRPVTLDIALFGRMVTSSAFRDVEAAAQVAHAISTHAVNQESDYYTAVDDLIAESDDIGAGMIGDTDYNACCFYHYISIDRDLLRENLRYTPDADTLIDALIPALIQILAFTNPSGKQNSFAGHSLPSLICVETKPDKIPVSYANAFAEPVKTRTSVVADSVAKLRAEIDKIDAAFGLAADRFWFSPDGYAQPVKAQACATLQELAEKSAAAWKRA